MAKRVLIVEEAMWDTGQKRSVVQAARVLPELGWDVTVFSLRVLPARLRTIDTAGCRVLFGTRRPRSLRVTGLPILVRVIREARRADVVLSGTEIGTGLLAGWIAARVTRRPFGIWVQCELERTAAHLVSDRLRPWHWRAYADADGVAPCSADMVAALRERAPDAHVRVVNLAGDPDQVRRLAEAEPPLSLPSEYVVGVGRLADQKGFDVLVRALAELNDRALKLHVVIAGAGPERRRLERLADDLGVTAQLHLVDFVENPFPIVRGALAFCLPSRYEGYPYALLEAQALGVPVIAADCPTGPRDQLAGGEFGALVPVDDPVALADALAAHLDDPAPLRARAAARLAHPMGTARDMARELAAFLDELRSDL